MMVYNEFASKADIARANGEAVEVVHEVQASPLPARQRAELEKQQDAYQIQQAELHCGEESRCLAAYERLSDMTRDLMLAEVEEAAKAAESMGDQPETVPHLPEFVAECGYLDVAAIRKADIRRATTAMERVLAVETSLSALLDVLRTRRKTAEAVTGEDSSIRAKIAELERRRLDAALKGEEHAELDAQILDLYQTMEGRKKQGLFASGELAAIDAKEKVLLSALEVVSGLKNETMRVKIVLDACVAATAFNAAAQALADAAKAFDAVKAKAVALKGISVRFPATTVNGYRLMVPELRYRWSVSDGNGGLQRLARNEGFLFTCMM